VDRLGVEGCVTSSTRWPRFLRGPGLPPAHEDAYLEAFDIKDFAHRKTDRADSRPANRDARQDPSVNRRADRRRVSVWGHTVTLIGEVFEMAIAREAVLMLLRGSEHKTVYRFLERKRADIKAYRWGF